MSAPCTRPECGGEVHTDGWGTPIQCPARRCPRCDCPDNAPQCDHCKTCPHATVSCQLVGRVPHDAHDGCPGWMADDGTHPEAPPATTPLEEAQATVEDLRYRLRRAREALAEDEPSGRNPAEERRAAAEEALANALTRTHVLEAAIARVRALHAAGTTYPNYGDSWTACLGCAKPWPCPTIRALDEPASVPAATQATEPSRSIRANDSQEAP